MICRQCSHAAARRGLCWRHYRRYLSGEIQHYAEWLNGMSPFMRAFTFEAEHGLLRAMRGLTYSTQNCQNHIETFAGLDVIIKTGADNV